MSEYSSLKATINANVKTNGNQEITGSIMNSVLNEIVNSLGTGYQFMGVATPTNPGSAQTPDYKCFYLATTPGTYTNLGGLVVADGEVAILKYDTSWTKEVTGIATAAQLNQLGQKVKEFFSRSISEAENPGTASSLWINNNGVIGVQASGMGLHRADYIEVSPEENVYISTTLGSASALMFLFCDNSGNVIDTATRYAGEGDPAPRFVSVPSGASRLYINYLSTYSVVIVGHIETLENMINNLCQPFVANRGIEAATGIMKVYGGNDYFLTAFIDVTNIPYISYDLLFGGTGYNLISAFDEDKNYIPENSVQPDKGWAEKSGIWTKGDNTKYVIIGFRGQEHRFAFCANPLPTPGAVTMEVMNSAISEGISEYQKQYGARKTDSNTSPMSLSESEFELGNLQGGTGAEFLAGNVIRSTIYYPVIPGDKLACATANSYRVSIFEYKKDLSYVSNGGWITGNGYYHLKDNTEFIRICLASPSGVSTRPVWNDAGLTIIPGLKYVPARAEAIDETDKAMYELPIIAPCPQIPADGSDEADFNAETLTPSILYAAFDSLLATLQKPEGNVMNYPKFGTKYSKVGRDATNAYDINAYVFGKRNRYGWKAADALFAWKNGQNVLYTDSISPRIGDVLYSDANRTNSGETVAIFSASEMSITSSGSATYTRQKSEDISAVVVYSILAQKVSSPYINIEVYDKTGSLLGTATAVDASTISYNSKNYTRCEDYDFHNKQKGSIILWGNEHGPQSDPAECAITLYRMAKDLCDGCRNNPFLSWLKENFMFILVPCVNPYGLVNHTRENGNGVNINRNYSTPGWSVVADADKGTYAGDQSETQFVMNLCAAMNPIMAIDIHCLGYVTATNEGKVHYEGQILAQQQLTRAIDTLGGFSFALSSYGEADPNTKSHGADWLTYQNIVGGLIEMNAGPYSSQPDGKQHSSHIMATDYTLLLNMIRVWLQEWNNKLDLSYLFIR